MLSINNNIFIRISNCSLQKTFKIMLIIVMPKCDMLAQTNQSSFLN